MMMKWRAIREEVVKGDTKIERREEELTKRNINTRMYVCIYARVCVFLPSIFFIFLASSGKIFRYRLGLV